MPFHSNVYLKSGTAIIRIWEAINSVESVIVAMSLLSLIMPLDNVVARNLLLIEITIGDFWRCDNYLTFIFTIKQSI